MSIPSSPHTDADPKMPVPAPPPRGKAETLLRARAPAILVSAAFVAVALWGYRTEWKFTNPFAPRPGAERKQVEAEDEADVIPPPKESTNEACLLDRTRVRLKSPEVAARMGLQTAVVERRPLRATLTAPAELDYDQNRVARLSARVPGTVVRVDKEVGQAVRKGEVMALVDAAEVGKVKSELLQSIAQLDLRQKALENLKSAAGAVAAQRIQEADAAVRETQVRLLAAQQALVNLGLPVAADEVRKLPTEKQARHLRLLGLPPDLLDTLDADTASANLIPVVVPFDGVVVERNVVVGEVVDPTKVLFVVADLSSIWVMADVRTEDADQVAVGQTVIYESEGHKGEQLTGTISWTSTTVDPRTRTLKVRAAVANPKGHWRARSFGTARVFLRDDRGPVTAVPVEALQRDGDCRYVFVQVNDTTFEARAVRTGVRGEVGPRKQPWVEVREGLRSGERFVTTGAFALKSEILKDRLGGDAD